MPIPRAPPTEWYKGETLNPRVFASTSFRQGLHPPTLHDLEHPPKRTRIGPANPSRLGVAPQKDKDWTRQPFTTWSGSPKGQGLDPPTLHDLERLSKRTRMGPPNPSRLGVAPQKDKDWTPPNPSRLGVALQKDKDGTPQPFTTWSGAPKGQGLDPSNPSRLGVALQQDKDWTPQPFTIWRLFLSSKLTTNFC